MDDIPFGISFLERFDTNLQRDSRRTSIPNAALIPLRPAKRINRDKGNLLRASGLNFHWAHRGGGR